MTSSSKQSTSKSRTREISGTPLPGAPTPPFRILVTGSRDWPRERATEVRDAIIEIARGHPRVVIVHGAARGADAWADLTAQRMGYQVERYPADWDRHGRAAGMIRNRQMVATSPDIVVVFPLGRSVGTRACMREAERAAIPVLVHDRGPGSPA